jgi:hypothetical protein
MIVTAAMPPIFCTLQPAARTDTFAALCLALVIVIAYSWWRSKHIA